MGGVQERDAEIIFGSLGDAGADFVHVTEFEAWKPAFAKAGPSLMRLAKRYAPKATVFANAQPAQHPSRRWLRLDEWRRCRHDRPRGLGEPRSAPSVCWTRSSLDEFDPAILGPIADIKDTELMVERVPRRRCRGPTL